MDSRPNEKWEQAHPELAYERKLNAAILGMYASLKLCQQIDMPPQIVMKVVQNHLDESSHVASPTVQPHTL